MSEKSKRKNSDTKCPICGSQHFEWGKVRHAYFVKDKAGFGKQLRASSTMVIDARQCKSCGNIQLFADVD